MVRMRRYLIANNYMNSRIGWLTFLVAALVAFLTACTAGDAKLSTAMAERALNKWAPNQIGKVVGVREIPEKNGAEVDFELKNFAWDVLPGKEVTYTGNADAHFIRYNDGRWILKAVTFNDRKRGLDGMRIYRVTEVIDTK